jgi:hypothetical protein
VGSSLLSSLFSLLSSLFSLLSSLFSLLSSLFSLALVVFPSLLQLIKLSLFSDYRAGVQLVPAEVWIQE